MPAPETPMRRRWPWVDPQHVVQHLRRGGRGGGGQDLFQCRSCGLDTGTTTALYRHVAVRCLNQMGETMEQFRRKLRAQKDRVRYVQHLEERRAPVRGKVSPSHHIILGTFWQSSSILG